MISVPNLIHIHLLTALFFPVMRTLATFSSTIQYGLLLLHPQNPLVTGRLGAFLPPHWFPDALASHSCPLAITSALCFYEFSFS